MNIIIFVDVYLYTTTLNEIRSTGADISAALESPSAWQWHLNDQMVLANFNDHIKEKVGLVEWCSQSLYIPLFSESLSHV